MGQYIDISEAIQDKKSLFNIKRFSIGNIKVEQPERALDIKSMTKKSYNNLVKEKGEFNFFEVSKLIDNYQSINRLYEVVVDSDIDKFFYKRSWLKQQCLVNFTLNFNPYNHVTKPDDMSSFFDLYYSYSNPFLFIPNINKHKMYNVNNKNIVEEIIDIKKYTKFVNSIYDILNFKNNKPIFVPVSLKLNMRELNILAKNYLEKGYLYFWFDFQGKAINEGTIGRIRHFFRVIGDKKNEKAEKKEQNVDIIAYYTNIRREIISNKKESQSPASDVLASIAGANIIGVNRKPRSIINNPTDWTPSPPEHKYRIFDNTNYYYEKTTDSDFYEKNKNIVYNSGECRKEFINQSTHFLQNFEIETYLKQKEMLTTYKDGKILNDLIKKR